MTKSIFRRAMRNVSAATILVLLLGLGSIASAGTTTKPPPPKKPVTKTPAIKHQPPPKSGGTGGGTTHGPTTGGVGSHGSSTGGASTHGPTTGGAGTHTMTTGGGTHTTSFSHTATGGIAPKGSNTRITKGGSSVTTRSNGKVSDVHDSKRGMDVHNNMGGGRRVSTERHDGSRVVSERGRRGYVERGYHYHGHDFGRRSYYYHGREYDRFYRGYGFRGLSLSVYAPGFYFAPGFYGWAYNPWAAPIAFGWGWTGNPWYGHFGYYFQPYPVYPSAAFWLTDYIISQDLQAAYAANQEAGEADGTAPTAAGGQPVLTPEVKQLVADEVKNQLALENSEAQQNAQQQDVDPGSSGIARLLSDGRPHVFVAGVNLDVTDASGKECVVSDGDTLQMQTSPPSDATTANLVVLSSKGIPECQISLTVQVQLTDLQEMQNHMRETIDQGLKDLQDKQGTGGLPAAPPSAQAPPAAAQYAAAAPPPEANLAADIQQQDQQADQAVKDSGAPAGAATAAPAAPASIELGQTTDQVQSTLGAPARVANLGPKVIYYYSGMKVTFKDGKVSDVQ